MQNEIEHLKEKVDYLENGNRRLQDSYEIRNQDLQNKLKTCENRNGALLDQCQFGCILFRMSVSFLF